MNNVFTKKVQSFLDINLGYVGYRCIAGGSRGRSWRYCCQGILCTCARSCPARPGTSGKLNQISFRLELSSAQCALCSVIITCRRLAPSLSLLSSTLRTVQQPLLPLPVATFRFRRADAIFPRWPLPAEIKPPGVCSCSTSCVYRILAPPASAAGNDVPSGGCKNNALGIVGHRSGSNGSYGFCEFESRRFCIGR